MLKHMKRGQIRVSVVELQQESFGSGPKNDTNATVAQVVSRMVKHAVQVGASDIHIEPRQDQVQIRYRVDGVLRQVESLPLAALERVVSHIKLLANINTLEQRVPQDGTCKVTVDGQVKSLQVLTLPLQGGEKVTIRIYNEAGKPQSLNDIGLWGYNLRTLTNAMSDQTGLVLVAGPTSSGKSTTLYALLGSTLSPTVSAVSVEDPIKQRIVGVDQVQVNTKLGTTFATGLRAALRHNPNVVMVSDIRDLETAELVVQTALSGRLVVGSVYSQGAITGLLRLASMNQAFLVASATRAAVGQRLVRTLCAQCKQEYKPDASELGVITEAFGLAKKSRFEQVVQLEDEAMQEGLGKDAPKSSIKSKNSIRLFRAAQHGCAACQHSGYKGRTGLFEVAQMTESLRHLVASHAQFNTLQQEAVKDGMVPLPLDGLVKALRGQTSIEEVLKAIAG